MRSLLHPTATVLFTSASLSRSWRFDFRSALIGAAVALLLVGLAYRSRDALRQAWESAFAPATRLKHRVRTHAEQRYCERVAAWVRSRVVPGTSVAVEPLFIEPHLSLLPPTPRSLAEVQSTSTVPRVLPLHRILGRYTRLAIVGCSGTGRTTLLAAVALACAGPQEEADAETGNNPMAEALDGRLPLYVSLPSTGWHRPDTSGAKSGDLVDRLTLAAHASVGGESVRDRVLRQRLEAGQAIILVDGWDELPPSQQKRATAWLAKLAERLPGNLWLVAAGSRGYAPLTETGFVPLRLVAWDSTQVEDFAHRWVQALPASDELPLSAAHKLAAELRSAARAGAPPLELGLRASVFLADGGLPQGRAAVYYRALDLLLGQGEETEAIAACRAALGQMALHLQLEGRATASREDIEAAVESTLPPPDERPRRAASHVLRMLVNTPGLLRPVGSDRYRFAHPLLRAYLAARQSAATPQEGLIERLDDPLWAEVLRFYAELGDVGPLVAEWLRRPDDLFRTRLHTLSRWIDAAPEGVDWRDGAMATLARGFLQPHLPLPVRRGLAEALAATGVSGVVYFFSQQIAEHPEADVRAAAIHGLAGIAGEPELPILETAMEDGAPPVRKAVVRALGRMRIDAATHWLGRILMAGDDVLSPIAAEALAESGDEGIALLRVAVETGEVLARRAAVLGLARAGARETLERVAHKEEQWIVRSAAATAADDLEAWDKTAGVDPPPEIEQLGWLVSWAAGRHGGMGAGDAARRTLLEALSGGDPSTRLAAARVLANVGRPEDLDPLKEQLADPDPAVANAAWEAMEEVMKRWGNERRTPHLSSRPPAPRQSPG